MKTLTEMLASICQQHARRTAVVEDEIAVSYRELENRVVSFAEQLYDQGIRPGDRVALFLPNGLEFVTSFFAIA
jgi:acyl-CoA synthetase (AMP-forming)/AMP-acid ligase II